MDRQPELRVDWEANFHGSQREVTTVIIGCDADFRRRERISRKEVAKIIQSLKDYVNLSYDSEATIAAKIGVSANTLNGVVARQNQTEG